MEPAKINRLKEEQQRGLHLCEEKILQWEKFKTDYETLGKRLETLPVALSYDITVPFGSHAFTKGKIVHTNEVMVLLGDNWFAEVSAKQAADVTARRTRQCEDMLQNLRKEKEQFQNWVKYIEEVSVNEDLIEIVETYDDEQEKKWREQHAINVKVHHQKLSRERENSQKTSRNSEDELWLQLENLELTEEEEEEESRMSDGSLSDEDSEGQTPPLDLDQKSLPEDEGTEVIYQDKDSNEEDSSESPESAKHVRWQDLSNLNIKKITFKHSKSKNKSHVKHQDFGEKEEQPSLIQSPSDIYKQFGALFPASPPKSILKVKHSPEHEEPFSFAPPEMDEVRECSTGQVRGYSSPIHIVEKKTRPVSHFKNSRKNRKR